MSTTEDFETRGTEEIKTARPEVDPRYPWMSELRAGDRITAMQKAAFVGPTGLVVVVEDETSVVVGYDQSFGFLISPVKPPKHVWGVARPEDIKNPLGFVSPGFLGTNFSPTEKVSEAISRLVTAYNMRRLAAAS